VVSFVNPKRVPQMAGAEEVLAAVTPGEDLTRAALVLNFRGYERGRVTSCEEVHVAFGVTETFNQRNQGRSVQESYSRPATSSAPHEDGRRATVTLAASCGCPFEGRVGPANANAAIEAGGSVLNASVGGIGGCPFAPRATGNIATEDLIYMLDKEGVDTGVRHRRGHPRCRVAGNHPRPPTHRPALPRRPLPFPVGRRGPARGPMLTCRHESRQ
jgi:hypothetical protein